MKRIALLAAAAVFAVSATASEKWPAEPDGFAGVKFGTPMADALAELKIPASWCKQVNPAKSKGVSTRCTHDDFAITEAIHVVAEFQFVKAANDVLELNGVELEITNRRFSDVKQLLFQKYGPPQVFDNKNRTDWLTGGQWKDQQYGWYGDAVSIFITEPPQPLARSKVLITRAPAQETTGEKKKSAFD